MSVFKRCGWLLVLTLFISVSHAEELSSESVAERNSERARAHSVDLSLNTSLSINEPYMRMNINGRHFDIQLNDTPTASALMEQLPLTLAMSDLHRNEKYAQLPRPLPTDSVRPGVINNGDVMLYGTDTLVVFYSTFNSSYSYTPLGKVVDTSGLTDALGEGRVSITFSMQQPHH